MFTTIWASIRRHAQPALQAAHRRLLAWTRPGQGPCIGSVAGDLTRTVHAARRALLARPHLVLLGPPGTAKCMLIGRNGWLFLVDHDRVAPRDLGRRKAVALGARVLRESRRGGLRIGHAVRPDGQDDPTRPPVWCSPVALRAVCAVLGR